MDDADSLNDFFAIPSTCLVNGIAYLLGVSFNDVDITWSGYGWPYDTGQNIYHHPGMEPDGFGNFDTSGDTQPLLGSHAIANVVNNNAGSPF